MLTNKYTNEVYLKRIRSDFVTKKQNRKSRNKFRRIFNYKIILQVIINKIFQIINSH